MTSTALEYISVEGFKSIAKIDRLPLGSINVLIGANGSGKSNFIGVFAFLSAVMQGHLSHYVAAAGGAERMLYFGSKKTRQMSFNLSFEGRANGYGYTLMLSPTADDGLFPSTEMISSSNLRHPVVLPRRNRNGEAGISNPALKGVGAELRARLAGWRLYHLHDTGSSSPMRKTAKVDDNEFLRTDGSNLAAFLFYLHEKHPESYGLIQEIVQLVAPFFDDFRLKPLRRNEEDIQLEWRHRDSDQYFGASSLSDGTLRFIALATLFLQPERLLPSAILVDEPELGLHPYAIEILASLIRQASVRTQVIISTQSSLLLDHFDPEDILVADRVEGATQINRLNSERLNVWLEEYSLGQLWEKNELGGRPTKG